MPITRVVRAASWLLATVIVWLYGAPVRLGVQFLLGCSWLGSPNHLNAEADFVAVGNMDTCTSGIWRILQLLAACDQGRYGMLSHYVLDAVQLVGLLLGALGLLYVSLALVGKQGEVHLRALLAALIAGGVAALSQKYLFNYFHQPSLYTAIAGDYDWLLAAGVIFVGIYVLAFLALRYLRDNPASGDSMPSKPVKQREDETEHTWWTRLESIWNGIQTAFYWLICIALYAGTLIYTNHIGVISAVALTIASIVGGVVYLGVLIGGFIGAIKLTRRQLGLFGLILGLLAITIQALPIILNLADVKIM